MHLPLQLSMMTAQLILQVFWHYNEGTGQAHQDDSNQRDDNSYLESALRAKNFTRPQFSNIAHNVPNRKL